MINFTEQQTEIINANFKKWGKEKQREKLVEELSELLCEVCKHRVKGGRETQICEELADVFVVLKGFGVEVNIELIRKFTIETHTINFLIAIIEIANNIELDALGFNWSTLSYFNQNTENLQKAVDFKIARMERKNNNQVEPYELNH